MTLNISFETKEYWEAIWIEFMLHFLDNSYGLSRQLIDKERQVYYDLKRQLLQNDLNQICISRMIHLSTLPGSGELIHIIPHFI